MTTRGIVAVVASGVAAIAVSGAALAVWWSSPAKEIERWRVGPPPTHWAAWDRQVQRWAEERSHRRIEFRYVPLAEISAELPLAVLVNEDINFFGHGPVDVQEIWGVVSERRLGARLRGASTISQQLARTLFLSPERTLWRKLKELRLAWWLERRLGKRRVLELYLNVVEFGPGVFGAEAASMRYLGVGCRDLDTGQAASLAAAIPAPGRDNPATGTERWEFRRTTIVNRMANAGWLRDLLATIDAGRYSQR